MNLKQEIQVHKDKALLSETSAKNASALNDDLQKQLNDALAKHGEKFLLPSVTWSQTLPVI